MEVPLQNRALFVRIFIPTLLIALFFIATLFNEVEKNKSLAKQQIIISVDNQIQLLKNIIEDELNSVEQDLILLSNELSLLDYLQQPTIEHQTNIELSWKNMIFAHPNIQQIRFLDAKGVEQIRIERDIRSQQIITSNEKQNKFNREYVQNGLKLNDGEIFITDFDLNKEFGEIQRPLNPTIRFIKRFDNVGEQSGMIIINYLSNTLFSEIDALIDNQLNIFNQNGYYIKNANPDKNWGWLLNRPEAKVSQETPLLWDELTQLSTSTVQYNANTLYGKISLTPEKMVSQYPTLYYTYPLTSQINTQYNINTTYFGLIALSFVLFLATMIGVYLALLNLSKQRDIAEASNIEAQKALSVKSKFLANMSHEIRTPLNGIMGFFQLLALEPLNKKQHEFAQNGLKSTRLLSQILNDILDFSKLEANKLTLQHVEFSLDTMVNDIGSLMSGTVQDKRLELWLDIEPNIQMNVLGDETRLRQVLVNLTSNAIKFTEEGFVKIKLTQTGQMKDTLTFKFEVIDSGIGLNNEQLTRVFNSFEQASMEVNKKYGGTGLGLNISQNILSLMDSKLEVTSEPMVGSTFSFKLTLQKGSSTNSALSMQTTQHLNEKLLQNLNVLLYSDNEVSKQIFDNICANFDWQVHQAATIEQVLDILDTGVNKEQTDNDVAQINAPHIHIVVVDHYEINDIIWQDLRKVKQQVSGEEAPLVYMMITLPSDVNAEFEKLRINLIDGHFIKPITPSMFYEEIATKLLNQNDERLHLTQHKQLSLADLDILLVEDNFINQEVVTNMLGNLSAKTTVAENGEEAIEILLQHPDRFDLILMDMQMPVMDGLTATTHIRKKLQLTDIPIIAMTANAMASDKELCFAAGMNAHLSKPFDQDMLIERIIANLPNA